VEILLEFSNIFFIFFRELPPRWSSGSTIDKHKMQMSQMHLRYGKRQIAHFATFPASVLRRRCFGFCARFHNPKSAVIFKCEGG